MRRLGNMFETRRSSAPLGAHGLSFLVEIAVGRGSVTALFDTGLRGDVLRENVRYLDKDLRRTEVVLSHGHPDHYGGLPTALELIRRGTRRPPVPLVLHEAALRERRWVWPGHSGGRYRLDAALIRPPSVAPLLVRGPRLVPGGQALFLTAIPRRTPYERTRPGGQVLHRAGRAWRLDDTRDDAALVIRLRERGLVILTGCGHAGVLNTVEEATRITGMRRVHALVGGFHLCGASAGRIQATIRDLRRFRLRYVIPSHCGGLAFEAALMEAFPRRCALDMVGTEYTLTSTSSGE